MTEIEQNVALSFLIKHYKIFTPAETVNLEFTLIFVLNNMPQRMLFGILNLMGFHIKRCVTVCSWNLFAYGKVIVLCATLRKRNVYLVLLVVNIDSIAIIACGKATFIFGLDKTAKLTVKEIKKAVTKLRSVNAPKINGDYVCIVHPYLAYDISNDPAWVEAHKYASPEEIYNGEIGKIHGCRFVETTEAKIWKDETCPTDLAVFAALFLGQNAYGVTEISGGGLQTIVKQKGSAGTADPLDQRSSVGYTLAFAA
jgi:hypothetical protein